MAKCCLVTHEMADGDLTARLARSVGYASLPLAGEVVCGDACTGWVGSNRLVLALADGLGHGEAAADAAQAALACLAEHLDSRCEDLFARCNERLRDTRGVALAVAIIEPEIHRLTIGTVGNIRALLLRDAAELRLDGARGIVGAGYTRLMPETLNLEPGNVLVLFSDGLVDFPALREVVQVADGCAKAQAQAILNRWAHGRDDAAVLVYRHEP